MSVRLEEYFFKRLQVAVKQFMAAPTEEARADALTAIRRCKAVVAKDYKALWEETEGILLEFYDEMGVLQSALDREKGLVREIIMTLLK
jgi:hypothetical protein